jgi:hypothetical protein
MENLKLPKELVQALSQRADEERTSLTELLWNLLEETEEDERSEDELMEYWKTLN